LLGDINMDGVIDDMDIAFMQAAWMMDSSNPLWDTQIPNLAADNPLGIAIFYSDCDLNGDGIVNAKDLGILSANYGSDIWSWLGWPDQSTVEWAVIGTGVGGAAAVGIAAFAAFFLPKS
jgi:hypothetical protein